MQELVSQLQEANHDLQRQLQENSEYTIRLEQVAKKEKQMRIEMTTEKAATVSEVRADTKENEAMKALKERIATLED